MNNYTAQEIESLFGYGVVEDALKQFADPTNRVIYDAFEQEHAGKEEWAGYPVPVNQSQSVRAVYYLTEDDEEDLDRYDWLSNAEFEIIDNY